MNTHALPRLSGLHPAALPHIKRRPFLDALQRIEYGSLILETPEGQTLEFAGPEAGPNAYLMLNDWGVFDELTARGEIAFAKAYIDGRCETADLPNLITFALRNSNALERFFHGKPLYALWLRFCQAFALNSLRSGKRNSMAHYELGNDFYSLWLDESMTYSAALFEGDMQRSLEAAQAAKYRRILRKLDASRGDSILEVGCGWGGFAEAAARQGMCVTAITLSPEQADYAAERIRKQNLGHLVTIKLLDYREVKSSYDHIVSIGMFEHIGERHWPAYFDMIKRCLRPGGRTMVQSIMRNDYLFDTLHNYSGFVEHYIFPGSMLPSKTRLYSSTANAGLMCREMYGFGQDYALTLTHWLNRFEARKPAIRALGYDEAFIRTWRYYLSSCIASFASRRIDVIQAEIMHGI